MNQASSAVGWDSVWEQVFAGGAWGKYPPEPAIRAIMRAFGARTDRRAVRVLDLGCGPGANTWFLAREGFTVAGIDGSPTAIEQNRARLRSENLDAELRVGDFTERLPWDDGAFDAVLDNASLYANPASRIAAAVNEVHRVLKPGGRLISVSFTDRTWGYGSGKPGPEPGCFVDLDVGPLAHKGLVQFLGRTDLERVFAPLRPLAVERSSYTLEEGQRLIEMWIVTGTKG
jgi:SAM-dependent methyltransferase